MGLPLASRLKALRNTSTGQPHCNAKLAAIALSDAMIPAAEFCRWFWMNGRLANAAVLEWRRGDGEPQIESLNVERKRRPTIGQAAAYS